MVLTSYIHHLDSILPGTLAFYDVHVCMYIYNHATTNLAIYSNGVSQDKLSKASNGQSIILIQMQDKLNENMFTCTCSFYCNSERSCEL